MNEITSLYGYLYLILSALIGLYFLWKLITRPENQPIRGIRGSKWGNICWLFLILLTIESGLLIMIDFFSKKIIDYRIFNTSFANVVDIILICHVFLGLFIIISNVRMQTSGARAGKLVVPLDGLLYNIILLLFLPEYGIPFGYFVTGFILVVYALFGGSLLLIILALIPILLTKKLFEISPAY